MLISNMDKNMKKVKEISPKKWGICAIAVLLILTVGMALLTFIVDPYFHYHAPIKGISYRLYEQQYINDGIARHFDYDAIIIGNSLSENVKASQVDELFDCKSIKIPYSGAGYKELWGSVERALGYNPDVKKVFVIVDTEDAARHKNYVRYTDYPEYLYDDTVWNDARYLWNKDVFYKGTLYNLLMTAAGRESTTLDEYSSKDKETGADVVLPLIGEIPNPEDVSSRGYSAEEEQMVTENINENIIRVTKKYPGTEFVLIYAPPSIARWAKYYIWGNMEYHLGGSRTATELLTAQDNITIYSFLDDFEIVCNLDNYRDTIHYTSEICEYMVDEVSKGKNAVTRENYQEYYERITEFYTEYDYQTLLQGE